jgi:GNAT superfamily N-acetyltransferase
MDAAIRFAQARDIDRLGPIENAADALLIERLHPGNWRAAPTSDERETLPGFILVTTGTIDDEDLRNNATNTASNDHAVGFAQVIEANGFAHLEQLSVLPACARQGRGRALVEAVKFEARQRGYDRITLRTFAEVPWNAPFYATCGFTETEPDTDFHRQLETTEAATLHEDLGPRIQMTALLARP